MTPENGKINKNKATQRNTNPFGFSDTNKRYHTYEYFARHTFGGRIAKIPLDIGLTCPNIDGKCGYGGCIYCSGGSFITHTGGLSLREQYASTLTELSVKWKIDGCIPYFQAHTNTYAPVSYLRGQFYSALSLDRVVGINIATRADCLADGVTALLAELSEKTTLTVELGLQSSSDKTAALINRGHDYRCFLDGYKKLRREVANARIGVHIIFGLPGEDDADMLETVRQVAMLAPDEVKIHLLYIVQGTKLAEMYARGEYQPLERERYIDLVCRALTLLPASTVISRLTGDGEAENLLAPLYSRRKTAILNDIDKRMYENGLLQGMYAP